MPAGFCAGGLCALPCIHPFVTWRTLSSKTAPAPSHLSLNDRWYLDVNNFARHTAWLHGFMRFYAHDFGVALLALALLVAWWVARHDLEPDRAVARVLWAAGGTVVIWGIAHYGLKPLVAEKRPYLVLPHVEVLLTRTTGYSFPSGHATVAGAVIAGLFVARRWIIATVATVLGFLLAFGRVYVGMHFPGDVAAGLAIGAAFVLVFAWPAIAILEGMDRFIRLRTPFGPLVRAGSSWARPRPSRWGDDRGWKPPAKHPNAS